MSDHKKQTITKFSKAHSIVTPVIWVFGILYTIRSHFNGCPHVVILGGWLVGPPFWLWLEFKVFFDRNSNNLKIFKYGQTLQRNLWLGITTLLILKYFSFTQ